MLFNCSTFKIFGDGGEQLILLASNTDGTQEAYIIHNPFVQEITMQSNAIKHRSLHGEPFLIAGQQTSEICLKAGEIESYSGINLEQQFNPVWSKTIRELMKIVMEKINLRG